MLDSLVALLEKGSINRKNFLKMAAAARITAVSARTVMAAPSGGNCLSCHSQVQNESFVADANTQELIDYAKSLGIDLIWDRGAICSASHDGNGGVAGLCCFRCQMGPCSL